LCEYESFDELSRKPLHGQTYMPIDIIIIIHMEAVCK